MVINGARCHYVLSACSFAPHSQAAVEAIPQLCVSERERPTPVWRRLSLACADLGQLNPSGVGTTSLINVWSLEAFSHHSMLHLYSSHRATLVPDWARSFSSSNAVGTNGCLDLSCRSCPPSGDTSLSYRRCFGTRARRARDNSVFWRRSSVGWMSAKIKRLSVDVGHRHPVTMLKASLMGLSIRLVWALRHQTGVQHSPVESNGQGWLCAVPWHPQLSLIQPIDLKA